MDLGSYISGTKVTYSKNMYSTTPEFGYFGSIRKVVDFFDDE